MMSVTPAGFGVMSSGSRVGAAGKTRAISTAMVDVRMHDVGSYGSISMRGRVFAGEFGGTLPILCTAGLKSRALSTSVALSSHEGVCDVVEVMAWGGGGSTDEVRGHDSFALCITSCVGAL